MDLSRAYATLPADRVSCYIYGDGKGRWRWEGVDRLAAVVWHSPRAFETRAECLADALDQGMPFPDALVVF